MRKFFAIWLREWTACFLSPVAYVTMVLFLMLVNWTFWNAVERRIGKVESITVLLFMCVFLWLPVLVTVVTMRLFAEEKRSGTIETLLTAPVTETEVVLGKYFGALSFVLLVLLPTIGSMCLLKVLSPALRPLGIGGLYGGGLLLLLVSALCVSIGLVVSLLTRNQIIAAICCFCGIIMPLLAGYLFSFLPFGTDALVHYLSIENHVVDFSRGSVDLRPIVLYLSGTFFMLFVAVRVLEARRWR